MQLIVTPDDLRPVLKEVVAEVLDVFGDARRVALSERDAADAIGVDAGTLASARRAGHINAAKVGRGYVYLRVDLVEFVAARRTGGGE
jgi:hypothetical protein